MSDEAYFEFRVGEPNPWASSPPKSPPQHLNDALGGLESPMAPARTAEANKHEPRTTTTRSAYDRDYDRGMGFDLGGDAEFDLSAGYDTNFAANHTHYPTAFPTSFPTSLDMPSSMGELDFSDPHANPFGENPFEEDIGLVMDGGDPARPIEITTDQADLANEDAENTENTDHSGHSDHAEHAEHADYADHADHTEPENKEEFKPVSIMSPRASRLSSPVIDSPRSVTFAETSHDHAHAGDAGDPENPTGASREPFKSHRKQRSSTSHFEYHQDPTGHIEKLKVYDDSGELVPDSDSDGAEWQAMPTVGSHDVYDDQNKLLMEEQKEDDDGVTNAAASGYTRVTNNDAASINSLDERTDYLFDHHAVTDDVDAGFQMAATKSMLTDQQKIAYAGICRLSLAEMTRHYTQLGSKSQPSIDALQIWARDFILKLYHHLDLSNEEQMMIESLAVHCLVADDLAPVLRQVQRVEASGEIMPEEEDVDTNAGGTKAAAGATSAAASADDPNADPFASPHDVSVGELHEEIPRHMDRQIEVDVKWTVMCDLFLNLLTAGSYDARSRSLLKLVGAKLGVSAVEVAQFERKVTDVLQLDDDADQDWTEKDIIERRRRKALRRKYAYVGLATVGGGLVIGLSAGLLAPIVGAGLAGALSTVGIAGTSSFLAGTGGAVMITTASTAIGASVGSRAMLKRAGHVKTFEFRPIYNSNRVNVIITVGGWMTGRDDDVRLPFSTIDPVMGDVLSVHWEPELMRSLGQTINILATEALAFGVQQILAATVFTVLLSSLQAPMWLAKLSYLVDNPWSVSLDRAWAAGIILADTLMNRKLGNRPATLVGYGLGSRVIYSCLAELGRKNAFGLVDDVFVFGVPVFYSKKDFAVARSAVSGRFVNGYSNKDWILAFLFPAARKYGNVLGLDPLPEQDSVDFNIENMDVSEVVEGHMSYRQNMPRLMKMCGISVLSEEFDEIEDPDPDSLKEKQRKLLGELSTAEKPKKTGFFSSWGLDFMQRAKKAPVAGSSSGAGASSAAAPEPGATMFDADAIREELGTLKPRIEVEQESMPLPEHTAAELPIELTDWEVSKPTMAYNYDEPPPPPPPPYKPQRDGVEPQDKKVQLQFDDLE